MTGRYILWMFLFVQILLSLQMVAGCKSVSRKISISEGRQVRRLDSFLRADDCIWTQGVVQGRELSCTIVNASTNDIVYLMSDSDLFYTLSYRNRVGGIVEYYSPVSVGFDGLRAIGVLSGQDPRHFSPCHNHAFHFKIKLPDDCTDVIAASVDFGYLQFSELSQERLGSIKDFLEGFYRRHKSCLKSIRLIKDE